MAYALGMEIPVNDIMLLLSIVMLVVLVIIVWMMTHVNRHMRTLEQTTLDIKKYEEQEIDQVRRFETDMSNFEADEAELFIARVVPTVSKLENYVAGELLKEKEPAEIQAALVKKGISPELATKVINAMTYYLDFFQKLPKKHVQSHVQVAQQIKVQAFGGK